MLKKFQVAGAALAFLGAQSVAGAAPVSSNHVVASKGQVVCDPRGCRSVKTGCRLEYKTGIAGGPVPTGGNVEVCPSQRSGVASAS
jgi:hypothetical protein